MLAADSPFFFDPFAAYENGWVTNPNMFTCGAPGFRKSTLVKTALWRMHAIYGTRRYLAVLDPKGEYSALAEAMGMPLVALRPGGNVRLNPLDGDRSIESVQRQVRMVTALLDTAARSTEGHRLSTSERTAVRAAVTVALSQPGPTLADVVGLLRHPTEVSAQVGQLSVERLATDGDRVTQVAEEMLSGPLAGMFDGPSTVKLSMDDPGVVIDLSSVFDDEEALPLVMLATTGWLTELRTAAALGKQWIQVLDECWAILSHEASARYLQSSWKLGRTHGVANWMIAHKPADLAAQSADGTSTSKIADGLLADTATRITLHQEADALPDAQVRLGLNDHETDLVGQLVAGRAHWRIGDHTAVVQHVLAPSEMRLVDTDANMRADGEG
ncbi:MAG: hypothetical protein KDB24_16180 [Microthrixaceae bacterium]|nr:hypothetical protein [Microthrixaceae bacterium]